MEDELTLRVLCDLGADIAQGYHFTRPLPPAELDRWLQARGAAGAHGAPAAAAAA